MTEQGDRIPRDNFGEEMPGWIRVHWADFRCRDHAQQFDGKEWRRHEGAGTLGAQLAYSRIGEGGAVLYIDPKGWKIVTGTEIDKLLPLVTKPTIEVRWAAQNMPIDPLAAAASRVRLAIIDANEAIRNAIALGACVELRQHAETPDEYLAVSRIYIPEKQL